MIIEEAVYIEQVLICDAIPLAVAMLGTRMNSNLIMAHYYIEYVTVHLLIKLSQPKLYIESKTLSVDATNLLLQNKANSLECCHAVGEYAKSGVGVLQGNHDYRLLGGE